jgi:hypothetical protein
LFRRKISRAPLRSREIVSPIPENTLGAAKLSTGNISALALWMLASRANAFPIAFDLKGGR